MVQHVRLDDFAPFRLIAVDRTSIVEIVSDGIDPVIHSQSDWQTAMFTSSGLGDHRVDQPRRTLFKQILSMHGASPMAQDLFHDHAWPSQKHLSVRMSRADARTVSQTILEMDRQSATLWYSDDHVCRMRCDLSLSQAVCA
jgi:hypothetical protein